MVERSETPVNGTRIQDLAPSGRQFFRLTYIVVESPKRCIFVEIGCESVAPMGLNNGGRDASTQGFRASRSTACLCSVQPNGLHPWRRRLKPHPWRSQDTAALGEATRGGQSRQRRPLLDTCLASQLEELSKASGLEVN